MQVAFFLTQDECFFFNIRKKEGSDRLENAGRGLNECMFVGCRCVMPVCVQVYVRF